LFKATYDIANTFGGIIFFREVGTQKLSTLLLAPLSTEGRMGGTKDFCQDCQVLHGCT